MHLEGLAMNSKNEKLERIRLGDYIERFTDNNKDLKYGYELIEGVTSEGIFSTPKGNTEDVNLKPYKVVRNGAFVYNPSRLNLGSIAYRTDGLCIVSHLYIVFYLNEKGKKRIDPDYLYMYLRRKEFYREVTFRNFGSQRPEFNFNDMCEIELFLPDIEIQKRFAAVYRSMVENQKAYELGLEDLKLACDGSIEELRRNMSVEEIGPYIRECDEKNTDLSVTLNQGIDVNLQFIPAKREAEDKESNKIVRTGQFAFNKVVKANGTKLPIALRKGPDCIISGSYQVFEITDQSKLLPEYLMLWLSRPETHRLCGFNAWGSTRDVFPFTELSKLRFPIPDITVQQSIANIYNAYVMRKEINEQLKAQIKSICPILIKGSLEEARA